MQIKVFEMVDTVVKIQMALQWVPKTTQIKIEACMLLHNIHYTLNVSVYIIRYQELITNTSCVVHTPCIVVFNSTWSTILINMTIDFV